MRATRRKPAASIVASLLLATSTASLLGALIALVVVCSMPFAVGFCLLGLVLAALDSEVLAASASLRD